MDIADAELELGFKGLSIAEISKVSVERSFDAKKDPLAAMCTICMDGYEDGAIMCVLSCFHAFHKDCVLRWLELHATCPVCKTDLKQVIDGVEHSIGIPEAGSEVALAVDQWEPEFEPIRSNQL